MTTVWAPCCTPSPGSIEALAAGRDGDPYRWPRSPYWITVRAGVVVAIDQQYLP